MANYWRITLVLTLFCRRRAHLNRCPFAPKNRITAAEFAGLRSQMTAVNSSQIAMSSSQAVESEGSVPNSSQFVTSSKKHRGMAYRPWAFTEHGAIGGISVESAGGR
jgi:hypothetical protein